MELILFDILIILFLVGGGIWGVVTGAVRVVAPFALIFALITLVRVYPGLSSQVAAGERLQLVLIVLLLGFAGLLIFGIMSRVLHGAVHAAGFGPINRLVGLMLGIIAGALMAGAVAWWLKDHGGPQAQSLMSGSALAPALMEFLEKMMAFTRDIVPQAHEKPAIPWWKRSLW